MSPAAPGVPYRRSTSAPSGNRHQITYYEVKIPETDGLSGVCPLPEAATSGDVPSWGLPLVAVEIFKKKGLKQIHAWQRECLMKTGIIGGQSLVYSLPTSGGKTYVAEVMLMRTVFQHRKIALFVLPYVAIVTEKVKSLKEFGKPLNFAVEGFFNNNGRLPLPKQTPILCICTIEKANLITNTLIEEGRIDELGLVVFDEMHMLSQQQRGYLLEILGTKIKYASNNKVQMVGMSATLPNLASLGSWLNAECYYRNFRPVTLVEHVFNGIDLLTPELKPLEQPTASVNGSMSPPPQRPHPPQHTHHYVAKRLASIDQSSLDNIKSKDFIRDCPKFATPLAFEGSFQLARELMPFSGTLIFCSSRAMSSSLALRMAERFQREPLRRTGYQSWLDWTSGSEDCSLRVAADRPLLDPEEWAKKMLYLKEERELLVKQLRAAAPSKVLNEDLVKCLMQGVAWHTAELGTAERETIERAFRAKIISVICCTSTLAAGVNLPARRVVLMTSKMGREELSVGEYRQMVGRAGRAGIDAIGESFLFSSNSQQARSEDERNFSNHLALRLLVMPMEAIYSSLSKPSDPFDSEWNMLANSRRALYRRSIVPGTEIMPFPKVPFDTELIHEPVLSPPPGQVPEIPPVSYFCFSYKSTPDPSLSLSLQDNVAPRRAGSSLEPSGCGIDRLVLDAIAGRSAVTEREIFRFVKCTFLASTKRDDELHAIIKKSIRFMTAVQLIESVSAERATRIQSNEVEADVADPNAQNQQMQNRLRSQTRDYKAASLNEHGISENVLVASQFGSATYRTSLSIESILYLREELERAMDCLALRDELHMCWLSIPIMHRLKPRDTDMSPWKKIVLRCAAAHRAMQPTGSYDPNEDYIPSSFADEEEEVRFSKDPAAYTAKEKAQGAFGARMGVSALSLGKRNLGLPAPAAQPTERFVLSLLLQDIVEEMRMVDVAKKYHLSVGDLEGLMQTAGNQAGQLASFCRTMGWVSLESLFRLFCGRVSAGAKDDILPLMKLRGVKVARARLLYNADFKTIRAVAMAAPHEIAQALSNGSPQTANIASKLASSIIHSAKDLLEETIREMRQQASRLEDPTPTQEQQSTPPTPATRSTRASRALSRGNATKTSTSSIGHPARTSSGVQLTRNPSMKEIDDSLAQIDHSFYDSLFGDDLLLLEELDKAGL